MLAISFCYVIFGILAISCTLNLMMLYKTGILFCVRVRKTEQLDFNFVKVTACRITKWFMHRTEILKFLLLLFPPLDACLRYGFTVICLLWFFYLLQFSIHIITPYIILSYTSTSLLSMICHSNNKDHLGEEQYLYLPDKQSRCCQKWYIFMGNYCFYSQLQHILWTNMQ